MSEFFREFRDLSSLNVDVSAADEPVRVLVRLYEQRQKVFLVGRLEKAEVVDVPSLGIVSGEMRHGNAFVDRFSVAHQRRDILEGGG